VTEEEVEIRYVIPTSSRSEHIRFCHLRLDYFKEIKMTKSRKNNTVASTYTKKTSPALTHPTAANLPSNTGTPPSPEPNKIKITEWITTIVCVLTLISTVVIQTVVASNQQKDLFNLQQESQKAYIILKSTRSGFEVTNLGPSATKPLKVTLAMNQVNPIWKSDIFDISRLSVKSDPLALLDRTQHQDSNTLSLFTNPIQKNETLTITLNANPSKSVKQITVSDDVTLYASEDVVSLIKAKSIEIPESGGYVVSAITQIGDYLINQYLHSIFYIAYLNVSFACDNCLTSNNNQPNQINIMIPSGESTIIGNDGNYSGAQATGKG
jgi:hypothetical protein